MTDFKNDIDIEQNYLPNSNADPKSMQELTLYVSFVQRYFMEFILINLVILLIDDMHF